MTITNKAKTVITPLINSKGFGATWGDLIATWGDAFFDWGSAPVFTNKAKTTLTPTDKTKTNIS